ncbi:hypothetical protein BJX76DRAFT_277687 [Aspergillus varians]
MLFAALPHDFAASLLSGGSRCHVNGASESSRPKLRRRAPSTKLPPQIALPRCTRCNQLGLKAFPLNLICLSVGITGFIGHFSGLTLLPL